MIVTEVLLDAPLLSVALKETMCDPSDNDNVATVPDAKVTPLTIQTVEEILPSVSVAVPEIVNDSPDLPSVSPITLLPARMLTVGLLFVGEVGVELMNARKASFDE